MAPGAARSTPPPSPAPDPRREGSPLHRAASVATTSTRGSRASCLLCRLRVVVPPPGCGAHRSPSRHPPLRRQERCVLLTMLAHHAAQMSDPSRWTRYRATGQEGSRMRLHPLKVEGILCPKKEHGKSTLGKKK
uniref:Uncharacterized protein n=1 Tax=Triticum urartu TaxID=4572 RepID=A0A8R7PG99_TRIUA